MFEKQVEHLNCCSEGFKSALRILNTNHQSYAAEIIVFNHFRLQNMLIYNKFISAQILIDTDVTDYVFINFFFAHKYQFLTEPIYTSLNLKAFNDQNAGQITYITTLLMFIPEEPMQHILFLITELLK